MLLHDLSEGDGVLGRVAGVARSALRRYDVSAGAEVSLLDVSENATFLVEDGEWRAVLRVHRLGYHAAGAVLSELDWVTALREEGVVTTPAVVAARDGERVVRVEDPGGEVRECVMFGFVPGGEPAEEALVGGFEQLGVLTARMHAHARRWERPAGFTRFHWDVEAAFGERARWGRWRDGAGVGRAEVEVLGRLEGVVRGRLARFGVGEERYGLIHADLRAANLLVEEGVGTTVIDFDDCGFGWFMYDFAAAVSFIEDRADVPEMMDSWVRGYRTVLELPVADERELWTFVMVRRLLLVAWIGTHPVVDIAQRLGAGYTEGTCVLAERYLTNYR